MVPKLAYLVCMRALCGRSSSLDKVPNGICQSLSLIMNTKTTYVTTKLDCQNTQTVLDSIVITIRKIRSNKRMLILITYNVSISSLILKLDKILNLHYLQSLVQRGYSQSSNTMSREIFAHNQSKSYCFQVQPVTCFGFLVFLY